MAGFACQYYSIENFPGDTPLGTSGGVFPAINWGWQGGLLLKRSEEKSVWTCLTFFSLSCPSLRMPSSAAIGPQLLWPSYVDSTLAFSLGNFQALSTGLELLKHSQRVLSFQGTGGCCWPPPTLSRKPIKTLFILYTHPIRSVPLENSA